MKLEEVKCKACGARLDIKEGADSVTCPYCNVTYKVQDMEDSGYEFEKGRLKAQREHIKTITSYNRKALLIPFVVITLMIIIGTIAGIVATGGKGSSSSEVSASSFNAGYNSGRTNGTFVEDDLNDIIKNNKTNNRKIKVSYNGTETDDPEKIDEIRRDFDTSIYYEIGQNYDDKGYITTYIIEVAKKTKEEIAHEAYSFNLYYNEGNISGFFIQNTLNKIIISNEKNTDKIIVVKYNDIESKEESDIEQIKSKMKTNTDYKVRFDYDEDGFIKQYNIEDK